MFDHLHHRSLVSFLLGGLLAVTYLLPAAAMAALPPTFEGLVKVDSKRLTAVYLLPGADFRAYKKVMIDPVQVAFRKGWQKDMNMSRGGTRRISDEDAQRIAQAVRSGFGDIFANAFKAKGYEVVTAPAPDVLRLSPSVVNLYLNAPDPMGAGVARTYTFEAGEATLSLEVRDSTTGALVGVAVDRRATRNTGYATFTTDGTNRSDFEQLFKRWADICTNGLEELKARSPLQPAQREKAR